MKRIVLASLALAGLHIVVPTSVIGQETVHVSNIESPSVGDWSIGADRWIATWFAAGSNPEGYTLDSIQLLMVEPTGDPSGFSIAIYARFQPLLPEHILGYLSGPEPSAAGVFTYTAEGSSPEF